MSKTLELYETIKLQYQLLSKSIDESVIKTDSGWELPAMRLAITTVPKHPWDICDPCEKQKTIHIESITWQGDNFAEFEKELSRRFFYALCDHFTPENKLWAVYKKNPDVDGYDGCISDEKHFKKIGQALKYAQDLIVKYFRDKTKVIEFPDIEYSVPTRCFDDGAYASSVAIVYKNIG